MLMTRQLAHKPGKEAAMSTISIFPGAATQGGRRLSYEHDSAVGVMPAEKPSDHSDAEMMYAWSIGVTGAARTMQSREEMHEECPPEVYIG